MASARYPVAMELRFYGDMKDHGSVELSEKADIGTEPLTGRSFYFKDNAYVIISLEHRKGLTGLEMHIANEDWSCKFDVGAILTKYWPTGFKLISIQLEVTWSDLEDEHRKTLTRSDKEVNDILEVMKIRGWKDSITIDCFIGSKAQKKRIAEKKPETSQPKAGPPNDDDEDPDDARTAKGKRKAPLKPSSKEETTATPKSNGPARKPRPARKPTAAGNRSRGLGGRDNYQGLGTKDTHDHAPLSIRSTSKTPSMAGSKVNEAEADSESDTFTKGQGVRYQREGRNRVQGLEDAEESGARLTGTTSHNKQKVYEKTTPHRAPETEPRPKAKVFKPASREEFLALVDEDEDEDDFDFFKPDDDPDMIAAARGRARERKSNISQAQTIADAAFALLNNKRNGYIDEKEEQDDDVEDTEEDVLPRAKRELGSKKIAANEASAGTRQRRKRALDVDSDDDEKDAKPASKQGGLTKKPRIAGRGSPISREVKRGPRVKNTRPEK